jgi:hypothetical protein
MAGSQEREGLEGFAKPHFIRQNPTQFLAIEIPQPSDAKLLIGP